MMTAAPKHDPTRDFTMDSRKKRKRKGTPRNPRAARHPLRGAFKETVQIAPGVDLTEPAEADWEKIWLEANEWWIDDPKPE